MQSGPLRSNALAERRWWTGPRVELRPRERRSGPPGRSTPKGFSGQDFYPLFEKRLMTQVEMMTRPTRVWSGRGDCLDRPPLLKTRRLRGGTLALGPTLAEGFFFFFLFVAGGFPEACRPVTIDAVRLCRRAARGRGGE